MDGSDAAARVARPVRAYVGLGANLGDRKATLCEVVQLLRAEPGIEVTAVSSLRETDPVDYVDQPRFVNGAVAIDTTLTARQLLERLLVLERRLGRDRRASPRFGPRTVDLDLLLYGAERLEEPDLVVPHPRLHRRRFALEPLAELDPELEIPGSGRVSVLLAGLE